MAFTEPCPKCHYKRKSSDQTPEWQCPACGVAYAKAIGVNQSLGNASPTTIKFQGSSATTTKLDRFLTILILLSLLVLIISWWMTSRLPETTEIVSEMYKEPIQRPTRVRPFDFSYREQRYFVEPVANYELWGVVVTHNNITGMTDITHTEDSVDIKDLCVVWGGNVASNDYREVSYSSGDFTCFFSYQRPLGFDHSKLSNNHLLSDNKAVRELIRNTKIGDQIYLKGMLVNYSPAENPRWVRRSSISRNDKGKRACEVVFVNEFEILKSSNSTAHTMFNISLITFGLLVLLKLLSFIFPGMLRVSNSA